MDDATDVAEFDDAFAALYVRTRGLAFALLGDLTAAEDVAAEALVQALARWRRLRVLGHRDAWVLRLATRLAVDVALRSGTRAAAPPAHEHEHDLVALDPAVVDALIRLPTRQRDAIVLVQLLGCTTADAAAAMKLGPSSVASQLRRGLDRLGAEVPSSRSDLGRPLRAIG